MKKIILSMAAISALAIAAPAAAQYSNNGYQNSSNSYQNNANANGNITDRIAQLRMRLQTGVQSGTITRQEAVPIRQQLQLLNRLERQYSVNGIDGRERNDLQQRIRSVRQQLRAADGGNQARWDRYDDEDGYGRNGQYGRNTDDDRDGRYGQYARNGRMDRNNDGYDDRDYDRDGRWDDDQQGEYRQPAQRGGIAGIFDALTGGGGLRVGQRASGNLYGVPNEYRGQFRDGNGAYYRSDGRQIYQIDARTDTVVRVYPMNR
jgi:hypothetical protein